MFPLGKKKIRECVLPARLCGNTINGLRSLVAQYRSGCTWAIADKQQSYLAKVTHTINLPFTAGEKEKKQLGVIRSDSLSPPLDENWNAAAVPVCCRCFLLLFACLCWFCITYFFFWECFFFFFFLAICVHELFVANSQKKQNPNSIYEPLLSIKYTRNIRRSNYILLTFRNDDSVDSSTAPAW